MSTQFFESPIRSKLADGEELLTLAGTEQQTTRESDTIVAVTDRRVIVFQENPHRMDDQKVRMQYVIPLRDIQSVWEHEENVTKTVVLKTAHDTYMLPDLYVDTGHVAEAIVSAEGLVPQDELNAAEDSSLQSRIQKGIQALSTGGALAVLGFGVIAGVAGLVVSLSFFGMLIGVPLYFLGAALAITGIRHLIDKKEDHRHEWVRPARRPVTVQQ